MNKQLDDIFNIPWIDDLMMQRYDKLFYNTWSC